MTITIDSRAADDTEARLQKRADIRRQIAELDQVRARAKFIREQKIRPLDDRLEVATAHHRSVTGPVQEQLATLEREISALITSREKLPDDIESRRMGLLDQLDAANEELEAAVREIRRQRASFEREVERLELQSGRRQSIENELRGERLANPELFLQAFVLDRGIRWASARVESAREQVRRWEDSPEYSGRLRRWTAELESARSELERAKQQAAEVDQQILAE